MPSATPLLAADPARIGRYRLAGRIGGRPGQGSQPAHGARRDGPAPFVIYLGRATNGEVVTITMLQPVEAGDTAARDRFMAEADAARQVAPFCVARMLDAGFHGDFPYLVSEHVPGPSLAEAVAADGPRAGDVLRAVAIGAATGLAAIHQAGLVHGHFGADRLVLGPGGPRVVHSGITPPYGRATPAADVHAWARSVLFAATGMAGGALEQPRPAALYDLPSPLRELIAESLDEDPGTRPPAKVIVTRMLGHAHAPAGILAAGSRAAAAARTPARAPLAGAAPAARPRSRRRRAAAAAITIAVVAASVAIAAVVAVVQRNAPGRSAPATRPSGLQQAASSPVGTATAQSAPAGTAAPAERVPGWLSGTWAGEVRQAVPPLTFAVEIRLSARTATGSVSYPSFGCSGVVTLTNKTGNRFVFRQGIVSGQQTCGQGTITLTVHGGTLGYSFSPATPGGPDLHGTLSRV